MKDRVCRAITVFFVLAMVVACAAGCGPVVKTDGPWERTELLLDTVVRIVAYGPREEAEGAIDAAFDEMRRLERAFDMYDPDSSLSEINNSFSGGPVRLSDDMEAVLGRAIEVAMLTGGAFDPTIGSLTMVWHDTDGKPPAEGRIRSGLEHVGFDMLDVDFQANTIMMPTADMRLDLGGIAKGYATDRAVATLKEHGIKAGMVVSGGSIRVFGKKPASPGEWVLGVQHPRVPGEVVAELMVSEQAVDTAGDYQRFFLHAGRRYHHIIDPQTGMPADGAISVTVVAPDAMEADALATGIFVMGVERGMELVEGLPGVEALIILPDGRVLVSSGFPGRVLTKQIDIEEGG